MLRHELAAVVLVLSITAGVDAQTTGDPAGGWRGVKVMPKRGAVVKVGDTVIEDNSTPVEKSLSLPWVVQNVNGEWLWVGDSRKGWVQRSNVVRLDEAPQYYTALINRGEAKAWAYSLRATVWHKKRDHDLAIADYGETLKLEPTAIAYSNRGLAWGAKKEYDKAIADYNQAIRLDPNLADPYIGRGLIWDAKKEYDKAIADYNQAIRLNPNFAAAYSNGGWARYGKKEYDKAIAAYQQALRLDPNFAAAYNNTAWLEATCPEARYRDGKLAVTAATKACELTEWSDVNNVDTLAAAYAEAGDFEQAIKWQQRAIELNADDAEFVRNANQRLELYRKRKPYRE